MPGMGPPPKAPEHRARRNASVNMTQLPAAGRPGRAPTWPLGSDIQLETAVALAKLAIKDIEDDLEWATTSKDRSAHRRKLTAAKKKHAELEARRKAATAIEREIWKALWKTPQSTQWEKRGWYREVALYARHQAKAEGGSLDDAKEARQREDRLGLNDLAMLRLRWEIAAPAEQQKATPPRGRRSNSKYRDLRVVS